MAKGFTKMTFATKGGNGTLGIKKRGPGKKMTSAPKTNTTQYAKGKGR